MPNPPFSTMKILIINIVTKLIQSWDGCAISKTTLTFSNMQSIYDHPYTENISPYIFFAY